MNKSVTLHGGPWHGKQLVISAELDLIKIATLANPEEVIRPEPGTLFPEVELRYGTYSSIRYKPGHFEWNGWEPK